MMRFIRKSRVGLVALAGFALVLTACSPTNGSAGESGGHLTVVKTTAQRTLDPAHSQAGAVNHGGGGGSNAVFDLLLYHDEDDNIQYVLAEDLSTEDGKTWELRLRPGIEFSDGTPLTAEAVKFSWERLLDPALGSTYLQDAARISSIEVVDETTATFEIVSVDYNFPYTIEISALNWIVPTWADDDRDAFGQNPVGAGPFVVDSWGADDTLELVRNENYWQDGLPKLNSMTILTNPAATTSADLFRTGAAQIRLDVRPISEDELASLNATSIARYFDGGTYLGFNTARPPFDDVRARQALAAAINNEQVNELAYEGLNIPAETIVAPGSAWYDPSLTQRYDPTFAQDMFNELAAEGKPVKFTFVATALAGSAALAQLLPTVLGEYDNVEIQVETIDVANFVSIVLQERDFDAVGMPAQGVNPALAFAVLGSGGSGQIATSWASPEFEAALTASRSSDDPEVVIEAYLAMQEEILAQVPAHFLTLGSSFVAVADGVDGLIVTRSGIPIYSETTYTAP